MDRKRTILLTTVLCALTPACVCAQSRTSSEAKESFQAFREKLHKDYNDFRSRIVEHYADFLEGEWHPYEPLMSPQRDETPKPHQQPRVVKTPKPETPAPVVLPEPKVPEVPKVDLTPRVRPTKPSTPATPPADARPKADASEEFDFYGMPLSLERVDFNILNDIKSTTDAGAQWRSLQKSDAVRAAQALDRKAMDLGLNGYLTFRLAEAYVYSKFPRASEASRMAAVHYLLTNMGYDARLALTSTNIPLLMLPIEQTVYGSLYLDLKGRRYTVFTSSETDPERLNGAKILTCDLPASSDKGREVNLLIEGLTLPEKMKPFELSGAGVTLKGEVNENLYKMLYRYPQMPTEDFARSTLEPSLRESLAKQVRDQLGGMSEAEAVNSLLSFFHSLPYATDQDNHGFEKPYFLEETLYYDKCDCEDRAIMFTWLLWNALGISNHLIAYPGHESASVRLTTEPAHRAGYVWEGSTYWSADPTYIGASVGDVMPVYSTTSPHIDLTYE